MKNHFVIYIKKFQNNSVEEWSLYKLSNTKYFYIGNILSHVNAHIANQAISCYSEYVKLNEYWGVIK